MSSGSARVFLDKKAPRIKDDVTLTFSSSQLRTFYIDYVLKRFASCEVVKIESKEMDSWEDFVKEAMESSQVLEFLGDWFFDLYYD